jgi:hypothetical protein
MSFVGKICKGGKKENENVKEKGRKTKDKGKSKVRRVKYK